jgi:TPR repeat protein
MLVASAAAAFLIGTPGLAASVKAGVDAWNGGDFPAAVREWRPLADKGDPDAQFNLGQAYKLGRGVPTDLNIAQSWYQKAAQQGHSQAQANLGLILFQNGNRAGAMPWIKKAADAGDPRAQYVLGTALFNGDLIAQDWVRAYALMQRSAAQGLPQAATNLAAMDRYIPLAQRQQGIALANRMQAGGAAPAAPAPAPAARTPRVAAAVQPARAAPVQAAAAPGGRWRVQLGAFGSAANARRAWDGLRSKVGALGSMQPAFVSAGAVTRLQAGPLASRGAADRVCAAAKAAGSACFPVAP